MNNMDRVQRLTERALPSRAALHYFLAKTHYHWAVYSANWGSQYWFQKGRDGFDVHMHQLRVERVRQYRKGTSQRKDARLAAWTRHCQEMSDGLKKAEKAGALIRQLLLERDESNAMQTDERIREKQDLLRQLHRRIRRPKPR